MLAKILKDNNQVVENNSGLIRYGFSYPGLSPTMLKYLLKYNDTKFDKDYVAFNLKINEIESKNK